MRAALRWGLAFVLADLLTGVTAFSLILFGAIGLAFLTGMATGLTSILFGGPVELLVGIAMTAILLLAIRGYRWILALARGPAAPGSFTT